MSGNTRKMSDDKKPGVALVLPDHDYGLAQAYISLFSQAGWSACSTDIDDVNLDTARLVILDFEALRRRPAIANKIPSGRLAIDLVYNSEYEKDCLAYPFHLLDNTTVIIHDHETRRLIKKIIRPINCRLVIFPCAPAGDITVESRGAAKIYTAEEFRGHPWLKGLDVKFTGETPPETVPDGSFIVIPEYHHAVWSLIGWGARGGLPMVAPGLETFQKTFFYGALLFDPGSEDDFRLKVSMLKRPPTPAISGKPKFGVVIPRYEKNTAGGAENHSARLAESLADKGCDVEILTTCADSMLNWENNLPEGLSEDGLVKIRRFALDNVNQTEHHRIGHMINSRKQVSWATQTEWMRHNIRSSALDTYIREHSQNYDRFFFVPYLYGTTFWASQQAPEKSLLVPCYHREPPAFAGIIRQNAQWVAGILFNSLAEKRLAENELKIRTPLAPVAGEGIDTAIRGNPERFRSKYGIDGDFILYVGRFQREKNLPELLEFFRGYAGAAKVSLVLAGKGDMKLKDEPSSNIRLVGFLPEQDKADALSACSALALPSIRESFSIVMTEAWAQGRPVIANGKCDAAREHMFSCNGGLLYHDADSFASAVDTIVNDRNRADQMGKRGREYVTKNFRWDKIAGHILDTLRRSQTAPLVHRLGEAAKSAVEQMTSKGQTVLGQWIADLAQRGEDATPFATATVPELLDKVEDFAEVTTDYREFSHRAIAGGVWSRFRGAVTRHLRKNYIELFEGKQQAYNRQTASLLRKLYEELRGKR